MRTVLATAAAGMALLGACGGTSSAAPEGPQVVVTTSILGDVVAHLVGDAATVEVLMPRGADPHGFAVSAKHAEAMRDADVVVRNGLGLEAGLDDATEAAADDGATVLTATDYVETVPFGADHSGESARGGGPEAGDDATAAAGAAHEDHDHRGESARGGGSEAGDDATAAAGAAHEDHDHSGESARGGGSEGGDDATAAAGAAHEDHDHSGDDPHVFTDPVRMAAIASGLAEDLAREIPAMRSASARQRAETYVEQLAALDGEVEQVLSSIPPERRVLVTNHEVFGYFARRYGFGVLGAVVPGGSTLAEPSASALAKLANRIERLGVPAIFVETSASKRVAESLAAEGADVAIVELYSESLGPPGSEAATYIDMVRTNAHRIADALSPSR